MSLGYGAVLREQLMVVKVTALEYLWLRDTH